MSRHQSGRTIVDKYAVKGKSGKVITEDEATEVDERSASRVIEVCTAVAKLNNKLGGEFKAIVTPSNQASVLPVQSNPAMQHYPRRLKWLA